MILETAKVTVWTVRIEQHAVLISERGILPSFRSAKRALLRDQHRILKIILTPEEEMAMMDDPSLSSSMEFAWFTGRHAGQSRTLEGVPVEIVEPVRPPECRYFIRGERVYPLPADPMETLRDLWRTVDPYSYPRYMSENPPSCRQCGQAAEHFFTSQRDQTNLCATCFGERETKQLAKDVTKSKHPLDAWMS